MADIFKKDDKPAEEPSGVRKIGVAFVVLCALFFAVMIILRIWGVIQSTDSLFRVMASLAVLFFALSVVYAVVRSMKS